MGNVESELIYHNQSDIVEVSFIPGHDFKIRMDFISSLQIDMAIIGWLGHFKIHIVSSQLKF